MLEHESVRSMFAPRQWTLDDLKTNFVLDEKELQSTPQRVVTEEQKFIKLSIFKEFQRVLKRIFGNIFLHYQSTSIKYKFS